MALVGYRSRKLQRQRDQRLALIRSLATSLIEYESIETTLTKAKTVKPFVEKLVTLAKVDKLANRRLVIARLNSAEAAHRLFDEIAPKTGKRSSGFLTIEKIRLRRGDNAQMARLSFVDDLSKAAPKPKVDQKSQKADKS